ncbi:hypothetical protein AX16_000493 [Volvariella volvacea WC 439]|nr:hypothetical protein AX16_000493 [Volvariella volvacea WC 439]
MLTKPPQDVDWHATHDNIFASVGDDKKLLIWDTRSPTEPKTHIQAHDREILAVSFSPATEHLLLTGSADKTCVLHDLRAPTKKLHVFESHTDEVLHLAWSPHNPTVFASASSDRRINVWDLSLIGQEQTPDDQEDGPPELLFIHGGHTARPTDFCWAPGESENWTAASVSEDNVVMVWQPTMRVWAGDEIKIDEKELEDIPMEGVESTGPVASGSGSGGADVEAGGEITVVVESVATTPTPSSAPSTVNTGVPDSAPSPSAAVSELLNASSAGDSGAKGSEHTKEKGDDRGRSMSVAD